MNENSYEEKSKRLITIVSVFLLTFLTVVVMGIVAVVGSFISTYNNLVDLQENVAYAEANVETMMQRRLELIPDLVSTVKAYTKHEEQVFEDITNAREALAQSFDAGNLKQISEANDNLTTAVNRLISIVEDNPEITASEQYISLMDQIEGSVNRISIARENYNEEVSEYNRTIRHFPGSILAEIYGFEEIETFKADESASSTNLVDFG